MSATENFPVVVITGPVGVGKTTTLQALSELLMAREVSHTMIDMDALTATFPRPPGDRFNARLGFRNLANVVRNARGVGSTRLIVAGVVESRDGRDPYRAAIPDAKVTVVRLVASIESIHRRIKARNSLSGWSEADAAWELDRAAELIAIMDAADVADVCIDTSDRRPEEVAREIGVWLGWLLKEA
ncbi:MAG: ATP/GTP-binding protein [Chloroflexota bacterium]|nr:ATP/GTP-binding protein [Chloroflexota bacterium]